MAKQCGSSATKYQPTTQTPARRWQQSMRILIPVDSPASIYRRTRKRWLSQVLRKRNVSLLIHTTYAHAAASAQSGRRRGRFYLAVKFLPDNKHLAGSFFSPEDGKSVRVYDFEIGECQQVLCPTSYEFFAIDVSPDGKMLASGGNGPSIEEDTRLGRQTRRLSKFTIWDLDSGKARLTNTGMLGRISSLSFSPDNKRIAYCDDATVTVIDIESGDPVWSKRSGFFPQLIPRFGHADACRFSPNLSQCGDVVACVATAPARAGG